MAEMDVSATRLNASGAVSTSRGRIRGVHFVGGSGAGTITLKDGGASGVTKLVIDTPGLATWSQPVNIPGRGILCQKDIYCVIAGAVFVTVFYEG
jgi:hypothetical protein